MSNYPEGLSGSAYCIIEGCIGRGQCPRCGETNYRLMGYYGAVATAAKRWGVSEEEAERRIEANQTEAYRRQVERCKHEPDRTNSCVKCGWLIPTVPPVEASVEKGTK